MVRLGSNPGPALGTRGKGAAGSHGLQAAPTLAHPHRHTGPPCLLPVQVEQPWGGRVRFPGEGTGKGPDPWDAAGAKLKGTSTGLRWWAQFLWQDLPPLYFSRAGPPFFIPRKLQYDLEIPLMGSQQYLLEVGAPVKEQIRLWMRSEFLGNSESPIQSIFWRGPVPASTEFIRRI